MLAKLTLVTNKGQGNTRNYLAFLARCLEAGVESIQLREKQLSPSELYDFGSQLRDLTRSYQCSLIINDHLDLAISLEADGLHLGQSDGDIQRARAALGPDKILGLSVDSLQQLEAANQLDLDYLGIGAIFPTQSKDNVAYHWGLSGLTEARSKSRFPLIAIGGICEANALKVIQAGAYGLAAIAAFHESSDLEQTINHFKISVG